MSKQVLEVTVCVSEPYVKVGGGWTSRRPLGLRRTYTAIVNGTTFKNESKADIQTVIRQKVYREQGDGVRVRFTFTSTNNSSETTS